MRASVYVLKDKDGVPFYVGATQNPHTRLSTHISMIKRVNTYVPPVYDYMRDNKIIPTMDILESKNYKTEEALLRAETRWILRLRKQGFYLANKCLTDLCNKAKIISIKKGYDTLQEYITEAVKEKNQRER